MSSVRSSYPQWVDGLESFVFTAATDTKSCSFKIDRATLEDLVSIEGGDFDPKSALEMYWEWVWKAALAVFDSMEQASECLITLEMLEQAK